MVRSTLNQHFIVRTTGLFGFSKGGGKGYNFVEIMIRAGMEGKNVTVVNDQVVSPTATADLARAIAELLATDDYGTYHITNSGACSYFEFTQTIYRKTGIDALVKPTSTESYGAPAARPLYSVLDNSRILSLGISQMPPWEDALEVYLAHRLHRESTNGAD